jgi:hypothetical protein
MVWDPVFSSSGENVITKVEKDGRYAVAVDGKVWSRWYSAMWPPVVSPDGTRVLIRAIEDGVYHRQVVSLGQAFHD